MKWKWFRRRWNKIVSVKIVRSQQTNLLIQFYLRYFDILSSRIHSYSPNGLRIDATFKMDYLKNRISRSFVKKHWEDHHLLNIHRRQTIELQIISVAENISMTAMISDENSMIYVWARSIRHRMPMNILFVIPIRRFELPIDTVDTISFQ